MSIVVGFNSKLHCFDRVAFFVSLLLLLARLYVQSLVTLTVVNNAVSKGTLVCIVFDGCGGEEMCGNACFVVPDESLLTILSGFAELRTCRQVVSFVDVLAGCYFER